MQVTTESFLHLNQLRRGQCAVVEEIDSHGPEGAHLASMGLTVGCVLHMLMPGAPCAVAVGETRLMLRCEQCRAIRVSPL
jgi:Fe2+ transport system protein FeoA